MKREGDFDFNTELLKVMPTLNNYSTKFGLSDDDRADLVSDTILKILLNQDKFKIKEENNMFSFSKFKGWCITILYNNMINSYRKKARHTIESFDNSPGILIGNEPEGLSADANVIAVELFDAILEIEKDEISRRIFNGYYNGYTYEEIAEIVELSLGAVKSRLFITRKKLKKYLTSKTTKNNEEKRISCRKSCKIPQF